MLVPSDMMGAQSKLLYQLNKFYGERVQSRKAGVAKTLREVCRVVQDVLKEVEVQEPRFISSFVVTEHYRRERGAHKGIHSLGHKTRFPRRHVSTDDLVRMCTLTTMSEIFTMKLARGVPIT